MRNEEMESLWREIRERGREEKTIELHPAISRLDSPWKEIKTAYHEKPLTDEGIPSNFHR